MGRGFMGLIAGGGEAGILNRQGAKPPRKKVHFLAAWRPGGLSLILAALPACAPVATVRPAPTAFVPVSGPIPAADAGLFGELVTDGPLASRVSTSPVDLVVYYGGEQRGSMETCGCPHRPRGSLGRLQSYVAASEAANPGPTHALVNAGEWLTDAVGFQNMPMPQLAVMDRTLAHAFAAMGWDALNVTPRDLSGFPGVDPAELGYLPMVSANIRGPSIAPYRRVGNGENGWVITGIAANDPTPADHPGYDVQAPEAGLAVLQHLAADPGVGGIVLLEYNASDAAKMLAKKVPKIVAIIDAADHNQDDEPFYVNHAVWVRSYVQTMRLGELRLTFKPDGSVASALDRHIDMDPEVPDDPAISALAIAARRAIDAASAP